MSQPPSKLEAVRLAKERLGEAPAAEVAAFVETNFGLKMRPAIAAVLLASLRERESLQASKARAMAMGRAGRGGAEATTEEGPGRRKGVGDRRRLLSPGGSSPMRPRPGCRLNYPPRVEPPAAPVCLGLMV
jgi:hypothetical protein